MKIVVCITSTPEDMQYLSDMVESLQLNLRKPDQILITLSIDKKYVIPNNVRKMPNVVINRIDNDLGVLSSVVGFVQEYKNDADVYAIVLNSNCTYPRNLLRELEMTIPELDKVLGTKIPNFKGSVYGLGGQVVVPDKSRLLEQEFEDLLSGAETRVEKRSIIGYVKENATVDVLESYGSIVFHRSQIDTDSFMSYLQKTANYPRGSEDLLLANYFAQRSLQKTQICSITLNRYILDGAGYTEHREQRKHRAKQVQEDIYQTAIKKLRADGLFCLWE